MASLSRHDRHRTGWQLRAYAPAAGGASAGGAVRHSIWLGDIAEREARKVKAHVEAILEARKLGTPVPGETNRWLAKCEPGLRRKLAPLLGASRSVGDAIDEYLADNPNKPTTVGSYRDTLDQFHSAFRNRAMRSLSGAEVDAWLAEQNVSANTVGKHAKNLKTWIRWCRGCGFVDDLHIATPSTIGVGSKTLLSAAVLQQWIDSLGTDPHLQIGLALIRWLGLRVPSELLLLTRGSVDWETQRIHVVDSKRTKRQSRGPPVIRHAPLFAELVPYLERLWQMLPDGPATDPLLPEVVAMGGKSFVRRCHEARAAADLEWGKLFNSVRATRETELITSFGIKAACEWIGNSPAVAVRNYEQITADTWEKATGPDSLHKTARTLQNTTES